MSVDTVNARRDRRRRVILDNAVERLAKIKSLPDSIRSDEIITARGERRRRRILDNAEARLAKITGRPKPKHSDNTPIRDVPKNNYCNGPVHDVGVAKTNSVRNTPSEPAATPRSAPKITKDESANEPASVETADGQTPNLEDEEAEFSFLFLKFQWIFLAVVVRLVLAFRYGRAFGESIIIPFAVVEVTLLILRKLILRNKSKPNVFTAILLLLGLNRHVIWALSECFDLFTSILTDLGVYLVTFICFHLVVEGLGDSTLKVS